MAQNAIFVGWGPAIPNREQQALQVFGQVIEYWTGLQQRGEIDSFETYALDPHGGDLNGFLIAKGDPEKLALLRTTDEFIHINNLGTTVVEDLGVVGAFTGSEMDKLFQDFGGIAAQQG